MITFFEIKNKNKVCPSKLERNKGFALLETIFYILLFAILSIAVINSMITMAGAFKEITIQRELMQGGNMMERISREIRDSYDINLINTNSLKLNTKDETGANKTIEFSLFESNITLLENDTFTGNLNTGNVIVEDLTFLRIDTTKGVAVKVFLTVKSKHDIQYRSEHFYDTIVLRGKY